MISSDIGELFESGKQNATEVLLQFAQNHRLDQDALEVEWENLVAAQDWAYEDKRWEVLGQ